MTNKESRKEMIDLNKAKQFAVSIAKEAAVIAKKNFNKITQYDIKD
ncbi:MAG: hypothetical protein NT001_04720 [Candidatus Woesearchaeota archaeon]|nr:hypothetical protein [Candidatus Woesearchaeota archaeon]